MKRFSSFFIPFFLALFLASTGWTKDILQQTAFSLALKDAPLADISSKKFKKKVKEIKKEVGVLFKSFLTVKGQDFFTQLPPFEMGKVLIEFKAKQKDKYKLKIKDGRVVIGHKGFDKLSKEYKIKNFSEIFGFYYLIFSKKLNPARLVEDLKRLGLFKIANVNPVMGLGTPEIVYKDLKRASLYVLKYGWGDCPAGCMYQNRSYIEVSSYFDDKTDSVRYETKLIGRSGPKIPKNDFKAIFLK